MNAVLENMKNRRSTRAFTQQSISDADLAVILEAGIWAPSGMNRQSWQLTVLRTSVQMEALAAAMRPVLGRDEGYNFYCPNVLVLLSNERENENGLADCACALQNIFLMAEDLGIGSCWINQLKGICDEPAVREVLSRFAVPQNHVVWGMAALGYPAIKGDAKPRRDGAIVYAD